MRCQMPCRAPASKSTLNEFLPLGINPVELPRAGSFCTDTLLVILVWDTELLGHMDSLILGK